MPSCRSARGWITLTLPALLLVTAVACGEKAPTNPAVLSGISVSPPAATLTVGSVMALDARALNDAGEPVDSLDVFWSTSNSDIATVSSSGLVTARAPGQARIAATALGRSAVATVTVQGVAAPSVPPTQPTPPPTSPPPSTPPAPAAVASVTVTLPVTTLREGSATLASATLRSATGALLTGRTVTWRSTNPSIATVSSSGLVTAKKKGTASIVATSEGKEGVASIEVKK